MKHYGAAKAGLVGLSNVLALERADHGIFSNTVLPLGFSRMVTETVDSDTLKNLGLVELISPEKVVPIVTYLASRACESSHENYSACAGRYARVFVGLGDGWLPDSKVAVTADDTVAHFPTVSATEPFTVPGNTYEEPFSMVGRIGVDLLPGIEPRVDP